MFERKKKKETKWNWLGTHSVTPMCAIFAINIFSWRVFVHILTRLHFMHWPQCVDQFTLVCFVPQSHRQTVQQKSKPCLVTTILSIKLHCRTEWNVMNFIKLLHTLRVSDTDKYFEKLSTTLVFQHNNMCAIRIKCCCSGWVCVWMHKEIHLLQSELKEWQKSFFFLFFLFL